MEKSPDRRVSTNLTGKSSLMDRLQGLISAWAGSLFLPFRGMYLTGKISDMEIIEGWLPQGRSLLLAF